MTMVRVKPAGTVPMPLPPSMRKPGRMHIPLAGASVALTRFIQRRLDDGGLVLLDDAAAKPAEAATSAKPAEVGASAKAADAAAEKPAKGS